MNLVSLSIVIIWCLFSIVTGVAGGICTTNITSQRRCQINKKESDKISCSGDMPLNDDEFKIWKYHEHVASLRALVMCNLPWNDVNPRFISRFPKLQRLTIINSEISRFTKNFPYHQSLMMLNLTRLKLTTITADLFTMLKSLRVLDLSHNRIKYLNKFVLRSFNNLQHLYLKGNYWDCSKDMKWILSTKSSSLVRKVLDLDQMFCGDNRVYAGKPVSTIIRFIEMLESECPYINEYKKCQCKLDNAVWNPDRTYLVPLTTINCTGLGWTQMPKRIPLNTTVLLLNNNKITDISPLNTNSQYTEVSDIYLDNNEINSLDALEGSDWMSKFRVLSVRANRLTKLPAYALDHSFHRNFNLGKLYLGNNPWVCDCLFTPVFKELILKYRIVIKDLYEIRCAYKEGDENSMKTIHNLPRRKVCSEAKEKMRAVDFVNIVLALLLLLLLGHFLYSYWIYKSTGQLPWIAMKLP